MTQPTTWEQATEDVAVGLPSFKDGERMKLAAILDEVEELLDELRLRDNPHEPANQFRWLAWLGAVGYVHEKWGWGGDQLSHTFADRCNDVLNSTLVLLPKKQHDYGPDNILWGGVQGVVVRAHDKLARIKNLRRRAEQASASSSPPSGSACGVTPSNESLADSYFDLIGYGIVGAMLVKGTFQLSLEADLPVYIDRGGEPLPFEHALTEKQQAEVREIVFEEMAKREKRKSHKVFIP